MCKGGLAGENSPRLIQQPPLSNRLVHYPSNEAGSRQPVATGFDPPDPETVALVDFNCPPFTSAGALPNPEIRTLCLYVISSLALDVVEFEVDEAFPDLFAPQECIWSFGGVRHGVILG